MTRKITTSVLALAALTAAGLSLAPGAQTSATASAATAQEGGAYSVDPVHSSAVFRVVHMGLAPFYGRFNQVDGSFDLRDGGSMNIVIDAASVDTNNKGRDNHVRSADFFNVAQFPKATFESSSVKSSGGDTYEVTGNLTIHGTTKEVTVNVTKLGEGDFGAQMGERSGCEAVFTISREAYGVGAAGGLSDDVTLMIGLEGVRE